MSEEKTTKHENLQYVGREFKKKGTTQQGKEWTLYKLKIMRDGKTEPNVLTVFDPLSEKSLQIKDLEDGEFYRFSYNEEPRSFVKNGVTENYTSKTVYFINTVPEEDETPTQSAPTTEPPAQTVASKDDADIVDMLVANSKGEKKGLQWVVKTLALNGLEDEKRTESIVNLYLERW